MSLLMVHLRLYLVFFLTFLCQLFCFSQSFEIENKPSAINDADDVYIYSQLVPTTNTRWWKAKMDCQSDQLQVVIQPVSGMLNRCNINVRVFKKYNNNVTLVVSKSFSCNTSLINFTIPKSEVPSVNQTVSYTIGIEPVGNACDNGELCVGGDGQTAANSILNNHAIADFQVTGKEYNASACNFSTLNFSETINHNQLKAIFVSNILPISKIRYIVWDFGDGTPVQQLNTGVNPTHTYQHDGNFLVRMFVVGECCSERYEKYITINCTIKPVSNFSSTSNGLTANFTSNSTTSVGVVNRYHWDFGDGTFDNTHNPNPSHTYVNAGTYNVRLTIYNSCGEEGVITLPVTVCPTFNPKLAASPNPLNVNVYPGQYIRFYSPTPGIVSYLWEVWRINADGTQVYFNAVNNPNPSFQSIPGRYAIRMTVMNECGESHAESIIFSVNEPPPVEIIEYNPHVIYGADPINLATGAFVWGQNALPMPSAFGTMYFKFFYNSRFNSKSSLGYNWKNQFDIRLKIEPDKWILQQSDGSKIYFTPDLEGGSIPLRNHIKDKLTYQAPFYILERQNGTQYTFFDDGYLYQIMPLNKRRIVCNYTTGSQGQKLLRAVIFLGGRKYYFLHYDSQDRMIKINDKPNSRDVHFLYGASGDLTQFVNVRGDTIQFTYDGSHNLTQVTDYRGNTIVKNVYNSFHQVTQQRDADGNLTSLDYNDPVIYATTVRQPEGLLHIYYHDDAYRLTKVHSRTGYEVAYEYNERHNQVSRISDNTGRFTSRTYNDYGFLSSVTNVYGNTTRIYYDGNVNYGFPGTIVNGLGESTTISYDDNWQPQKIILPNDSTIDFKYHSDGRLASVKDENNDLVVIGYDSNWNLNSVSTSTGVIKIEHNAAGFPIAIIDRNNKRDSISTDAYGNIVRLKDPLGYTQAWTYNRNGYPVSYKDKKGAYTYFNYNNRDLLTAIVNARQDSTRFFYDAMGRRVKVQQPKGNTFGYKYDYASRIVESSSDLGSYRFQYDLTGNRTRIITPTNDTTKITYDLLNRPTAIINALQDTIQQVLYDHLSRPIQVFDGKGQSQQYQYDKLSRLSSVTDPMGRILSFTRDGKGRVMKITDASGKVMEYTRNVLGLATSTSYDGKQLSAATYDNEGYLTTTTHNNITATITRDDNYFPIRLDYSNGKAYELRRDQNGWVQEVTHDNWITKNSFTYDALGNVTQSTDGFGHIIQYTYDKNQNRAQVTLPGNKSILTEYNGVNLPVKTQDWLGNYQRWVYNPNAGIDSVINSNGTKTFITWDVLQRMKSYSNLDKSSSTINSYQFSYDKNYQITNTQVNELLKPALSPKVDAYKYAEGGRLISMNNTSVTTQSSGEVTQIGGFTDAVWKENDLLTYYVNDGDTIHNAFDPLGQRIKRVKNGQETRYVLDQSSNLSHVLQETNKNGVVQRHYIHTPFGLGWNIDGNNDQPQFYHFSYNGNTIGLTNAQGILTDKYASTIFGDFPTHEGSSTQPYQFGGQYGIQRETGSLYHVRARTLNGYTGSFMSQDAYPVSLTNSQSFNRYHYGYNDPVSYVDFDGFQASAQGLLPYYERSSYVGVTSNYDYLTNSVVFVQNTLGAAYNEVVNTIEYELEMYPITVLAPHVRIAYDFVSTAQGLYTIAANANLEDVGNAIRQPETYEYILGSLIVPSPNKTTKITNYSKSIEDVLNLPYKHIPIKQVDLGHVIERHWYNSTASNAGKFLPGLTPKKLQQMVNQAVDRNKSFANRSRYGNIKEGFVYYYNFDHLIGVSINGNITNRLRVVLYPDGNLKTTFPDD